MKENIYGRERMIEDMFVRVSAAPELRTRGSSRGMRAPILVITILVLASALALSQGNATIAFLADTETSTGNTFAAGPLHFDVATSTDITLAPGDTVDTIFTVTPGAGSLPFSYKVIGAVASTTFCKALSASGSAPLTYPSGSLASLTTSDAVSLSPWTLSITFSSGAGVVNGDSCVVDLMYHAWQIGGALGTEFHADRHVFLTVHATVAPIVVPLLQTQSFDLVAPPPGDVLGTTTDTGTTTEETPPPSDPIVDTPPSDTSSSNPPPEELPVVDTGTQATDTGTPPQSETP